MSLNVQGSFSRNSASSPPQASSKPHSTSVDTIDIRSLVERHKRLVDHLFPFKVAWDACLYIVRWENYPLTVVVACVFCVLLYHPSLFLSCLVLLAIVTMAIGKYYGQTKNPSLIKTREPPNVDQLNHDLQALQQTQREQKTSHLLLVEYKQIVQKIEGYFLLLTKFLDYLYRVILWKSPEVSLCVTVLLLLCFVLLCTVYLRLVASCVPILILCLNRHFLNRTVDLWRRAGLFIYRLFKRKRQAPSELTTQQPLVNGQREEVNVREERTPSSENVETEASSTEQVLVSQEESEYNTPLSSVRESPRPVPTNDNCAKCLSAFTLLKRRHKCANCGETFCGSCTAKVKRTLLGATAPAAYLESVRVCMDCKEKLNLINREDSRTRATTTSLSREDSRTRSTTSREDSRTSLRAATTNREDSRTRATTNRT